MYARWEYGLGVPERLVLLELQGRGWIRVRREDDERERIRTDKLAGPFKTIWHEYEEREAHARRLQALRPTYEQFCDGVPCPGCGRPYAERTASGVAINNHGRSALADANADEAFRANHRDCRFRVFGWYHINGGPLHCGACCPPPEFSPETLNKVAAIVAESIRRQQAEANAERARADAERAKAANRARHAAKLERHVKAIIDGWPELTQAQRERLRPLLQEI
jgi:hypothetical protein